MTVAELLTFLIHADQSKEVVVEDMNDEGPAMLTILGIHKDNDGDIVLET